MRLDPGLDRYTGYFFATILLLALSPFVLLSAFAHPSADDFCMAVRVAEDRHQEKRRGTATPHAGVDIPDSPS